MAEAVWWPRRVTPNKVVFALAEVDPAFAPCGRSFLATRVMERHATQAGRFPNCVAGRSGHHACLNPDLVVSGEGMRVPVHLRGRYFSMG